MAEWISVKDRLPEDCKLVMVFCGKGHGLARYTSFADSWRIQPFLGDWYQSRDCVIHWMPLPEPPEAKSWTTYIGDARDEATVSITIDVSDSSLSLSEFEDRVHKIFERAMTGIKRE